MKPPVPPAAAPALCLLLALGCRAEGGPPATSSPPPDAGKRAVGERGAVASANALASEAGLAILRDGGNAVDAAVATAFAVGVVEPQMSGLGGSGAMVVWRQAEGAADHLDFYAAQPVAAFRRAASGTSGAGPAEGDPGLRVVGVPGAVAGLLAAHERFGRLPRERVMAPAIRLAEEGYPVGQILATFVRSDSTKLARDSSSLSLMWPGGEPRAVGDVIRNPELAASLRAVAEGGAGAFYRGDLARRVVAEMNAGGHPVTLEEFAGYEPVWRRPLCIAYRGRHVLSAPPPQTGAQVLETLQLLEPHDLPAAGLPTRSVAAFDLLTSALRVGMADNRGANDDPRWREVHAAGRVAPAFAAERAGLVGSGRAPDSLAAAPAAPYDGHAPEAGCSTYRPYGVATAVTASAARLDGPGGRTARPGAPSSAGERVAAGVRQAGRFLGGEDAGAGGETTHVSVVDGEGNAVALTQTNSTTFGSGASVGGFFLNDSGYLFRDGVEGGYGAPAWRTRASTISPTIVVRDGGVEMVVGAPGGGRIPTEIAQVVVYVLDYGMDPLEAVRMPRIYPSPVAPRVQLEHGFAPEVLAAARDMGYDPVPPAPGYARLYLVVRREGRWVAVADPRHDGEARAY